MAPLYWVEDSSPSPSCSPNRLPRWEDYTIKNQPDSASAETAVRFVVGTGSRQLMALFDHEKSWVKPEFAHPNTPEYWRASENLLAHEQLHFMISCLLIRQANQTLRKDGDPQAMITLVKSIAQRINLQYDNDTNHGLHSDTQYQWKMEIQRQFDEISLEATP